MTSSPGEAGGRLALIAASRAGARLAARLGAAWPEAERYVLERYRAEAGPAARGASAPLGPLVGRLFRECRGLVFFLPLAAVVRLVAPHLGDKLSDPAVVAVDDGGRFAISVLAGHAGGANELAERVAEALGATPVVTTAAERLGLPAPESLGLPFGWRREATKPGLRRVAAALVDGQPIGVYQDAGPRGWLPPDAPIRRFRSLERLSRSTVEAAIVVTDRLVPRDLYPRAVIWRPARLVLGMGCSRGAPLEELLALLDECLVGAGYSAVGLACVATLDRKLTEPGLIRLAEKLGVELRGFSSAELRAVAVPNPSETVRRAVGTPSVAEAAALLASGGRLLAPKRASACATAALAELP